MRPPPPPLLLLLRWNRVLCCTVACRVRYAHRFQNAERQ